MYLQIDHLGGLLPIVVKFNWVIFMPKIICWKEGMNQVLLQLCLVEVCLIWLKISFVQCVHFCLA